MQYISDFTNLQDYSVSIAINGCWFIPVCTVHNLTIQQKKVDWNNWINEQLTKIICEAKVIYIKIG